MHRPLRLAHCSDIHLDSDYFGGDWNLTRRDRDRAQFDALLAAIGAQAPDLMLLAGDLFDHNRASAGTIEWACERLAALPFPVVMIPGNHDCLAENAIYHRHDFAAAGVHVLLDPAGQTLTLAKLGVAIWGRGMVDHHPGHRPLADVPARPDADLWYLGLAHGVHVPAHGESRNSSPIHAHEIENAEFDYLALGHIHCPRDVSAGRTPAWYSGAPHPVIGEPGSFLSVTLTPGEGARVAVCGVPPVR
ncbi:metallophosphoesterase [Immundisolibacter sp.]|uniref:metallophosphoesterase family protein n=1 Tax=Immundisolibacter sp. TaxID=1934948 RepID=UPI0026261041|nr:metallophosphoesterase [Immundisolibacter sp.]MDD3652248.1 metallophosphoesterase [Immundisolibacter sp.]